MPLRASARRSARVEDSLPPSSPGTSVSRAIPITGRQPAGSGGPGAGSAAAAASSSAFRCAASTSSWRLAERQTRYTMSPATGQHMVAGIRRIHESAVSPSTIAQSYGQVEAGGPVQVVVDVVVVVVAEVVVFAGGVGQATPPPDLITTQLCETSLLPVRMRTRPITALAT